MAPISANAMDWLTQGRGKLFVSDKLASNQDSAKSGTGTDMEESIKIEGSAEDEYDGEPRNLQEYIHILLRSAEQAMGTSHVKEIADKAIRPELIRELSMQDDAMDPERVLFIFSSTNPVRRFFMWFGNSLLFDTLIYACIACQILFLIFTPAYIDMPGQAPPVVPVDIMSLCNHVFTMVFTFEFFVRILRIGVILTPGAYFKSGWNMVDFCVLAFSWMDFFELLENAQFVKVVRLTRALRPLRLITRIRGACLLAVFVRASVCVCACVCVCIYTYMYIYIVSIHVVVRQTRTLSSLQLIKCIRGVCVCVCVCNTKPNKKKGMHILIEAPLRRAAT